MIDLSDLVGRELSGALAGARYVLGREIGRGTQGIVLLADRVDDEGRERVVVKVWHPEMVAEDPQRARLVLQKETVALERLARQDPPSPFVVRLLDAGELERAGGQRLPFLVLEHVLGGPLGASLAARVEEHVVSTGAALLPSRARRLIGHIARGVGAIHGAGIVHRDVKPTNVLVCGAGDDELAKVTDFGVSRPSGGLVSTFGAHVAVGTIGFAAPELRHADRVSPASDIFSLGAITYFLLTGEPMFSGPLHLALAAMHRGNFEPLASRPRITEALRASGAGPLLDQALAQATAANPAQRPTSAEHFLALVTPLLDRAARSEQPDRPSQARARVRTLLGAASLPWSFRRVHRPAKPLALRAAAIDPDGHILGVTTSGLYYFTGGPWRALHTHADLRSETLRSVARIGPGLWLGGSVDGALSVFSKDGRHKHDPIGGPGSVITAVHVPAGGQIAAAGHTPTGRGFAYLFMEGQWRVADLGDAAVVRAMAPAAGGALYLAGQDRAGTGLVWLWDPRLGKLERAVARAPLRAVASGNEGNAFAVGENGVVLALPGATAERAITDVPLDVTAVDASQIAWAAGRGLVLRRGGDRDGALWSPAFSDATDNARPVALLAGAGLVVVVCEDGSILRGEQASKEQATDIP